MPVAPIRPKGPPLNALRAFEAAARLGGFAAAAEELSVTPGAVAQHIKALEEWAEAPLFERRSQGVELTTLGADVADRFSQAFDSLGLAVQTLRVLSSPKAIHIATLPSIAQLWLSPLLPEIRQALADTTISVTVLERAPNLHREPFDASLFFDIHAPGTVSVSLHDEVIFPVCSRELACKLVDENQLQDAILLHDANWIDDWGNWFDAAFPNHRFATKGPTFSLYSLAVEEAIRGAGVLIGHAPIIDRHLEHGNLIAPFPMRLPTGRKLVLESTKSFAASDAYNPLLGVLRKMK